MSSDPPSGGLSPEAELARERGEALLQALEGRVPGSRKHAEATGSYALACAAELGFERDGSLLVREAARLHEVGRLYVDTDPHAVAGYRLALGAGVPEQVCGWILRSGERFDAAPDIPLEGRIISAACEYDTRLAEHARLGDAGTRWALIGLAEQAGGKLDPITVDALARVVERAAERSRA